MPKSNQRGRKNNNPEGRNQHSGWMDSARDRPFTTAAAVGAAAAAGAFLWSKRDRISEKASQFGEKAGQWSESMRSGNGSPGKMAGETGTETVGKSTSTGAIGGSSRSTGGRGGKAQSGQNMNPSRTASETVTY